MRLNHPLALSLAIAALSIPSFAFDYEVQRMGGDLSHMGALAVVGISVASSLVHIVDGIPAHVRRWSWAVTVGMAVYMFLVILQTVMRSEFQTQAGNAGADSEIATATAAIKARETLRAVWQESCDQVAAPRLSVRTAAATACANISRSLEEDKQDREILANAQRARVKTGADLAGDAYIYFTAVWRALVFPVGNVACLYFSAVLLRRHEAEKLTPAPPPEHQERAPEPQEQAGEGTAPQPEQAPDVPPEQERAAPGFVAWLDGILGQSPALPAQEQRQPSPERQEQPQGGVVPLALAERGEVVAVEQDRVTVADGTGGVVFLHTETQAPEVPAGTPHAQRRQIEKAHAEQTHQGELPKLPAPPKAGATRTKEEFQAHCRAFVERGGSPSFRAIVASLAGNPGSRANNFSWWQEIKPELDLIKEKKQ